MFSPQMEWDKHLVFWGPIKYSGPRFHQARFGLGKQVQKKVAQAP